MSGEAVMAVPVMVVVFSIPVTKKSSTQRMTAF